MSFRRPLLALPLGIKDPDLHRVLTQTTDTLNDLIRLIGGGDGDTGRFLRRDAQWVKPPSTATDLSTIQAEVDALETQVVAAGAIHLFHHHGGLGSGSGNATMFHSGQGADINNSPAMAPVTGTFTSIRVRTTGNFATPTSGGLTLRLDIENAAGSATVTLTFPGTTSNSAVINVPVTAGQRFRLFATKSSLPTDPGAVVAWLTLTPS